MTAVDVGASLFGPALTVVVVAVAVFLAGRHVKRHARRRLDRHKREMGK